MPLLPSGIINLDRKLLDLPVSFISTLIFSLFWINPIFCGPLLVIPRRRWKLIVLVNHLHRRHCTGNIEGLYSLPGCVDTNSNDVGDLFHVLLGPWNALWPSLFFLEHHQHLLSPLLLFCVYVIDLLHKLDRNSTDFFLGPGTTLEFLDLEGKQSPLPLLHFPTIHTHTFIQQQPDFHCSYTLSY